MAQLRFDPGRVKVGVVVMRAVFVYSQLYVPMSVAQDALGSAKDSKNSLLSHLADLVARGEVEFRQARRSCGFQFVITREVHMQTRPASFKILQDASKVMLLFAALVFSPLARTQDTKADARSFSDSVLAMFDQGKYSDIYDLFDSTARQMTREQWVQACHTVAQQRGKVMSRELSEATKSMGYRFVFAAKSTAGKTFEDLSLTNNNGTWKLLGFWVKPNLESDNSR